MFDQMSLELKRTRGFGQTQVTPQSVAAFPRRLEVFFSHVFLYFSFGSERDLLQRNLIRIRERILLIRENYAQSTSRSKIKISSFRAYLTLYAGVCLVLVFVALRMHLGSVSLEVFEKFKLDSAVFTSLDFLCSPSFGFLDPWVVRSSGFGLPFFFSLVPCAVLLIPVSNVLVGRMQDRQPLGVSYVAGFAHLQRLASTAPGVRCQTHEIFGREFA